MNSFRDRIRQGDLCLGTCITFTDPTVTEALGGLLDFVWIDMEHSVLSLEAVQGHVMAAGLAGITPLVRVAWNDPVLVKPVLDLGAAGIIVPQVRTADEARRAVEACLYPPQGVRGYGPRRPSRYGQHGGPAFCQAANASVIVALQIEHIDGVRNLGEILAVPGITSLVLGPNDLAASTGRPGQPDHPDVRAALDAVIEQSRRAKVPVGIATGEDPERLASWAEKGVSWIAMGADFSLLARAVTRMRAALQEKR